MYRTDFWALWEKARVGCFKRTALKHVYYLGWNRSPAQVGCMRQVLGPGALGRLRGIGWRGRWEGGLGWGTHVNPWLIHFNVWQNPLQYCKVISLQLIKKKKNFPICWIKQGQSSAYNSKTRKKQFSQGEGQEGQKEEKTYYSILRLRYHHTPNDLHTSRYTKVIILNQLDTAIGVF